MDGLRRACESLLSIVHSRRCDFTARDAADRQTQVPSASRFTGAPCQREEADVWAEAKLSALHSQQTWPPYRRGKKQSHKLPHIESFVAQQQGAGLSQPCHLACVRFHGRNTLSPLGPVMVPLLEPPLLLERGWEEAEDRESPGPVGGLGVEEGDGVKVGDVLLDVEEFPD
ncbi:hypothetical protein EYF80_045817 [Liparis tanakae]|uniref:Uncharacterized protein n=1 Tax=Liparis tanakae TaxID=230148 RepID=A0A4Z2FS51_9TELE|nr:hypothetical protein EYF80_045817 [Liparis tanakae]